MSGYEVAVSAASHTRAEQLQSALKNHDAAMSQATETYEAAFREAEELASGGFAGNGEGEDEAVEPKRPPAKETQARIS